MRGFELAQRLREEALDVAREDRRDLFLEAANEIELLVRETRDAEDEAKRATAKFEDALEEIRNIKGGIEVLLERLGPCK